MPTVQECDPPVAGRSNQRRMRKAKATYIIAISP